MIAPPAYLSRFEYWFDDVLLDCWLDFEAADRSAGQNAAAHLVHAYVSNSGMDVADLLRESVTEIIETAAAEYLSQ